MGRRVAEVWVAVCPAKAMTVARAKGMERTMGPEAGSRDRWAVSASSAVDVDGSVGCVLPWLSDLHVLIVYSELS